MSEGVKYDGGQTGFSTVGLSAGARIHGALEYEPDPAPLDPWARRGSQMRCRTCVSYVAKQQSPGIAPRPELGRCRRHAPTISGFPVVFPSDWCGDHKLDEEKV